MVICLGPRPPSFPASEYAVTGRTATLDVDRDPPKNLSNDESHLQRTYSSKSRLRPKTACSNGICNDSSVNS